MLFLNLDIFLYYLYLFKLWKGILTSLLNQLNFLVHDRIKGTINQEEDAVVLVLLLGGLFIGSLFLFEKDFQFFLIIKNKIKRFILDSTYFLFDNIIYKQHFGFIHHCWLDTAKVRKRCSDVIQRLYTIHFRYDIFYSIMHWEVSNLQKIKSHRWSWSWHILSRSWF